jgi:hypothetical protein
MIDWISEWIELLLVNLGIALTSISTEQQRMITLFLASLLFAAVVVHALRIAVLR